MSILIPLIILMISVDFWCRFLRMKLLYSSILKAIVGYSEDQVLTVIAQYNILSTLFFAQQAKLVLRRNSSPIDHAEAYGRIAFSCPRAEVEQCHFMLTVHCSYFSQLPGIEQGAKEAGYKILTPLVSLDTPGKATVEVVILADPVSDGISL